MNLCKISISSQVTTVTLKHTTVYLKSAPGGSRLRQQRNRGGKNLGCPEKPRLGRLADGQAGRNGNRVPWFFTITPLFGTIASWGFGVNIHHLWTRDESGGREALEQTEQQNKDRRKVGAFFVYSDQRSSSLLQTFLSYEELSFFFVLLFLFFCQNQTCCLSCVCCTCDSWERESGNWRTKDAGSANRSRPGGHDWKRIHMTTLSTSLFPTSPFSFPASSIIIYFIVKDTQEWRRPVAITKLYVHVVEKLAFSSTVCVFGTRWINKVVALVFLSSRFIDDVSVDATARPGSHVGSQCHDVIMKFFGTSKLAHL